MTDDSVNRGIPLPAEQGNKQNRDEKIRELMRYLNSGGIPSIISRTQVQVTEWAGDDDE